MPHPSTDPRDRQNSSPMPAGRLGPGGRAAVVGPAALKRAALESAAAAICSDATHDPLAYVLRSDTQQDGE